MLNSLTFIRRRRRMDGENSIFYSPISKASQSLSYEMRNVKSQSQWSSCLKKFIFFCLRIEHSVQKFVNHFVCCLELNTIFRRHDTRRLKCEICIVQSSVKLRFAFVHIGDGDLIFFIFFCSFLIRSSSLNQMRPIEKLNLLSDAPFNGGNKFSYLLFPFAIIISFCLAKWS